MVKITLIATEGGFHPFMNVTLMDISTNEKFSGKTDANGKVSIAVPANATYQMLIPDYTEKKLINVPNAPGATMTSTLYYSRNMVAEEKSFAMNESEKAEVDNFTKGLPDTTFFKGNNPFITSDESFYSSLELNLSDLKKGPLANEKVILIGRIHHKTFTGTTDANGKLMLYLPKGDNYDLNFTYHKNFEYTECKYSKGTSEIKWEFEYMGTKEFLRKKKEDDDRQAAEAKAIAEAKQAEKTRRAEEKNRPYSENGFASVMDRNNFSNPLVIADASSDMAYIDDELEGWFAKNAKANPNSQFVFFNDGDMKPENQKTVGSTGGLYYTPALSLDKLSVFMNNVIDKSNDNDSPDNYVEALISGMKMAKQPYTDVVLLVDNHSTPRDMNLLSQVNHPVHVVVFCSIKGGCDHSFVRPDYLKIAWKTKGTLHINGIDYNDVSKLKNGETIKICETNYKLVNGEFFQL